MQKKYFLLFVILAFFNVHSQEIIHFTDPDLKAALINPANLRVYTRDQNENDILLDANNDGEIDTVEALAAYNIQLEELPNVSSLDGIQYFTNLNVLSCFQLPVNEMNVSALVNLKKLIVLYVPITTLDVSSNIHLQVLALQYTDLTALDTTPLQELVDLNFRFNTSFEDLIMGEHPLLTHLVLSGSNLREVNVNRYPALILLGLEFNQLTSIDVSNLHNLWIFYCNSNQITNLDASHSPNLGTLYCADNPFLENLNIKGGLSRSSLELTLSNLPMLKYICADDNFVPQVQQAIVSYGLTNCHVNSYCSFIPGGEVYSIEGQNRFNTDGNGCGVNSAAYPNLKFSISNGTTTGTMFGSTAGTYNISVQEGTHTIIPILENDYFSISPATAIVTFPTAESPLAHDFCLLPNGTHHDLEVTAIPLTAARPGFDSDYKIIYTNKGTAAQSGSLSFEYHNEVSDLVITDPIASATTSNTISWNFTDLQPFESRFVTVKLNHNSPVETPALNDGDQLRFAATLTTANIDETPENNVFQLNQDVVNSQDPNDKTCLEGNQLTPEISGKFVHYMIRFENTGSASAVNVVVQDLIDTTKFDISSLVPIGGSHDYMTKISEGNKVEFIFENIQLPFDDANNDGYIVFKIKTTSAILNDNMFSNKANIYFDYNFPIITNNATTTLSVLAVKDFDFAEYFTLYPNPVGDKLNIKTQKEIKIASIDIYNVSGHLIQTISNPGMFSNIDISDLKSGNYFIKIHSHKGVTNARFVKE